MIENKLAYTTADQMTVCLARLLRDGEKVFHGVSSHMPMIAMLLARAMHAPNLVHLNIPGGVCPQPVSLQRISSAGDALLKGASAVFPLAEVFDLSMRGQLDVAFLSGIQFDESGNVNASVIGDYHRPKVRMPGGAGSAVLIPTARRAIIWRTKHDPRTFVPQVDFVTTRGNLDRIVTPLCVFAYENGRLIIDSIHPVSSLAEVQRQTGFAVSGRTGNVTAPPTELELKMLKKIDPRNLRAIEFERTV